MLLHRVAGVNGRFESVASSGDAYVLSGEYVILSGTGRFTDATGEGSFHMISHPDGTVEMDMHGAITYNSAQK